LILIAKNDRKLAIQVGYGMEHLLTDAMSRRIIELVIVPHFKQGDYYGGLDAGTTAIMEVMAGEYRSDDNDKEDSIDPMLIMLLFIFIIIFLIILSRNRGDRGNRGGRSILDNDSPVIILHRGGRGGFGGGGIFGGGSGGFGGGGFGGGFGGGGFGGGGASGGW